MNCNKILCLERKPDYSNLKIFFGEYDHLIRIDYLSSEAIRNIKETAESNTWFVKQISYERDIIGWENVPDVARRMFLYNINYQNAMDSGVTNGFLDVMVPILTDPNWQLLYIKIGYEESIHSESYSYALTSIFGDKATEYIDLVYTDPFIQRRLANEIDAFSEVKNKIINRNVYYQLLRDIIKDLTEREEELKVSKEVYDYLFNKLKSYRPEYEDSDENKLAILKMILSNLFLEGIKFPLSFFVTWNIHLQYNNAIQGIDTLIKEIAHDELNTHVPTGNLLLRTLKEDESQGFSHFWKSGQVQEMAIDLLYSVIKHEDEWIDFLCEEGEIPGFTKEIARHFIRYFADRRLKVIGVDPIFKEEESDVIKWFKSYSDINQGNIALQEADNTAYQKSGLKNDIEVESLHTLHETLRYD